MKDLIPLVLITAWLTATVHDLVHSALFALVDILFFPLGILRGFFIWFGVV